MLGVEMAKRKIIAVGFEFPGNEVEYESITSHRSLQDADIIVFEPTLDFLPDFETPLGVLSNAENKIFLSAISHWKSELEMALKARKTILAFLPEPKARARLGSEHSNFDILPVEFTTIQRGHGKVIVPDKNSKLLDHYWQQFAKYSSFEAYIEGQFTSILFTTKDGSRIVGASVETLLLLPSLQYDYEAFVIEDDEGNQRWTEEAISFGNRLVSVLIEIDKALHGDTNETPAPEWVNVQKYRLSMEAEIELHIQTVNSTLLESQNKLNSLENELSKAGSLRRLLFESGHQLEEAILDALNLLGFKAERYMDNESEFDTIFTSPEGRFIGEAEGKDNKPINIDKLSQLERVMGEDYAREDVTEYAKGVLFGNAYRLIPPEKREAFFTEKCINGAKRIKAALVRTPDLFLVAHYLKEKADPEFAAKCRKVFMLTEGEIVKFPPLPKPRSKLSMDTVTKEIPTK
jgi:hypothetical protein